LEEMMIAKVHPVMTVYTVKGGQRKMKNHIINFPQNVLRFYSELPLLPDAIPLMVRRERADGGGHYDFRVRREKVRVALEWLKVNNTWYREVVINNDHLGMLPEDGNLQNQWELPVPPIAQALEVIDDELEPNEMGINNFF
jgi:hypothetical protein